MSKEKNGSPSSGKEASGPAIEIEGPDADEVGATATVEAKEEAAPAEKAIESDVAFLELEIEKLRRDVEKARADAAQAADARMRALAELDNVRKRSEREKDDIRKYGIESLLREVLGVWDNLTRAVDHATNKTDPVVEGVEMVLRQFADVLQRFGVVPFHALGEIFNPARHEAISRAPMDAPLGTVGVEVACGFMIRDRLLRPAMVVVSDGRGEEGKDGSNHRDADTQRSEEEETGDKKEEAGPEAGAGALTEAEEKFVP
ncbi:MAG: nucleotide exchange factor GrpE [Deltaproteobacteria bacterium]|nr:nucleotide exchange factor GrpE [Deltaproteobacteria bacterium]